MTLGLDSGSEDPLWDPLIRAIQDEDSRPRMNIVIV